MGQDCVDSPAFTCFGHQWLVRIYPGGYTLSARGNVAAILHHCSLGSIDLQATFVVKDSENTAAACVCLNRFNYCGPSGLAHVNPGASNGVDVAERSTLIGALKEGALIIEVQMKLTGPNSLTPPFLPTNPFSQNFLKKFLNEETADVAFEIISEPVKNGRKTRSQTSSTVFHAHRLILPENGALAEACESSSDLTPIPITGVEPVIFRQLLFYLYGGKIQDEWLEEDAKDIIDAADKFGVVELKLEAEAAFVSSTPITMDNVMDNLLYADAKNCPLLKEYLMDFLVQNGKEAYTQLSFDDVPGCLLKDLLGAVNRGMDGGANISDTGDLSIARVDTLRKMLHEKGLNVDGSRETLIARLEENSSD